MHAEFISLAVYKANTSVGLRSESFDRYLTSRLEIRAKFQKSWGIDIQSVSYNWELIFRYAWLRSITSMIWDFVQQNIWDQIYLKDKKPWFNLFDPHHDLVPTLANALDFY